MQTSDGDDSVYNYYFFLSFVLEAFGRVHAITTSVYQDSIYYLQSGVFQALLQFFQGTSSANEL